MFEILGHLLSINGILEKDFWHPSVPHSRERMVLVIFVHITKTYLYNFDPLISHSYIVKLGFTGYTLFFLFLLKNIDCGYSLEPPRPQRGGSNEYPQSMF